MKAMCLERKAKAASLVVAKIPQLNHRQRGVAQSSRDSRVRACPPWFTISHGNAACAAFEESSVSGSIVGRQNIQGVNYEQ